MDDGAPSEEERTRAKRTEDRIEALCARLGEHFPDYLVIVRTGSRGLSWRSSEATWAMGAAERYAAAVKVSDSLEQADNFRRGV